MSPVRHHICNTCLRPTSVELRDDHERKDFNCEHCGLPVQNQYYYLCPSGHDQYVRFSPENYPESVCCCDCHLTAVLTRRPRLRSVQWADSNEVDRYIEDCEKGIPEGREAQRKKIEYMKNRDAIDECLDDAFAAGDIGIERNPPKPSTPTPR